MNRAKRDELRKTILIEETKGFSGFPVRIEVLELLLNRTDKCDELEAKCKIYESALKTLVGHEPFDGLIPRVASEALEKAKVK